MFLKNREGSSDLKTVLRYAHLSSEHLHECAEDAKLPNNVTNLQRLNNKA